MPQNIVVTTAIELTPEARGEVDFAVSMLTGESQVNYETKVDPQIIGGVRIAINGRVYDATVSAKLEKLINQ